MEREPRGCLLSGTDTEGVVSVEGEKRELTHSVLEERSETVHRCNLSLGLDDGEGKKEDPGGNGCEVEGRKSRTVSL